MPASVVNGSSLFRQLRQWARATKRDIVALYLAARDPRVPWYAKVVAACVVAYALSPIDLIPDFVPVLGYLDDLVIVPLGILLALTLVPADLMADLRAQAERRLDELPVSRVGAAATVAIWLAAAAAVSWWLAGLIRG
ncbi:MAG: DUF1232 domain-containing protein [Defluviicoccus sp.]|nr:MAG: DUF1232 domain-containing protein [Defluviicoccus sp.]